MAGINFIKMQTILGANGIIATELAKELYSKFTKDIRLVSRNPKQVNGTDLLFTANLLDAGETEEAVKGSDIVYLTVGLPNNWKIVKEQWPVIIRNVINACIKNNFGCSVNSIMMAGLRTQN